MKYCASTEFLLFPGKRALTLIHQFQRWGKITGKFAVHKPTVYRVGLNGLDPFIELCDFFSKNNQEQPFVTPDFHSERSGNSCCQPAAGSAYWCRNTKSTLNDYLVK